LRVALEARLLKRLVDALSEFLEEAVLVFDVDGLTVSEMNRRKTVAAQLRLPTYSFEEYHVEERTRIPVPLPPIRRQLRSVGKDETVELIVEENTLRLKTHTWRFRVHLLARTPSTEHHTHGFRYTASIKLVSSRLKRITQKASQTSAAITLTADSQAVKFQAGDFEEHLPRMWSEDLLDLDVTEPTTETYPSRLLAKAAKHPPQLTTGIRFGRHEPVNVEHPLDEGYVAFWIAPHVETQTQTTLQSFQG